MRIGAVGARGHGGIRLGGLEEVGGRGVLSPGNKGPLLVGDGLYPLLRGFYLSGILLGLFLPFLLCLFLGHLVE